MKNEKKITKVIAIIALTLGIVFLIAAILGRSQHYLTSGMLMAVAAFYKLTEADIDEEDYYD